MLVEPFSGGTKAVEDLHRPLAGGELGVFLGNRGGALGVDDEGERPARGRVGSAAQVDHERCHLGIVHDHVARGGIEDLAVVPRSR